MKWDAIKEHDQRIAGVLRRARDQHDWVAVEDHTPLDALIDSEPEWDERDGAPDHPYSYPSMEQPDLELSALKMEEALQVADWARRQTVGWIAGAGLHPFRLVQRFYAFCFAFRKDLIGPLNGDMLGEMLGQGRAAFSATMEALFSGKSLAKLGMVVKVAGQKSAASSAAYAANAAKHKPKQQLNGVGDGAEHPVPTKLSKRERDRKVKEARLASERRELAKLTGCNPADIDPEKTRPLSD